jgi:hypothetical protein
MSQVVILPRLSINGGNPSQVSTPQGFTGNSTGIQYFPGGSGGSAGVPAGLNSLSNGYISPGPNQNGQIMTVKAAGDFTISPVVTSSPATTIGLYPVTFLPPNSPLGAPVIGSAIVSQTLLGSAELAGYYPWAFSVDLMGTNNSGLVQAMGGYIAIDGTAGTFSPSVILNGINMSSALPFALVVGITFSVRDYGAQANMYEFGLNF